MTHEIFRTCYTPKTAANWIMRFLFLIWHLILLPKESIYAFRTFGPLSFFFLTTFTRVKSKVSISNLKEQETCLRLKIRCHSQRNPSAAQDIACEFAFRLLPCFARSFVDSFVCSSVLSVARFRSFVLSVRPFVHRFLRSFACSFVRSALCRWFQNHCRLQTPSTWWNATVRSFHSPRPVKRLDAKTCPIRIRLRQISEIPIVPCDHQWHRASRPQATCSPPGAGSHQRGGPQGPGRRQTWRRDDLMRTLSQSQCVLLLWPPYWRPNGREGLVLSFARCGFGKRINSSMFDWIILLFYLSVDTYLYIYIFSSGCRYEINLSAYLPSPPPVVTLTLAWASPPPSTGSLLSSSQYECRQGPPFSPLVASLDKSGVNNADVFSVMYEGNWGCLEFVSLDLLPGISLCSSALPLSSSKSTFSQPFQEKCINGLLRVLVVWWSFVWITY